MSLVRKHTAVDALEERQLYDNMPPRYLPFPNDPQRLGLAEMPVRVAHKTGR